MQEPDPREVHEAAVNVADEYLTVDGLPEAIAELREVLQNRDEEHSCETSFSKGQCDSCGSTLAGDRSEAWGIPLDDREEHFEMEICVDCMMFHANGEEPETWTQHPQ